MVGTDKDVFHERSTEVDATESNAWMTRHKGSTLELMNSNRWNLFFRIQGYLDSEWLLVQDSQNIRYCKARLAPITQY